MNRSHAPLIADLVETLEPVRAMKARDGLLLAAHATAATVLAVWSAAGFREGITAGAASPFFFITNGLLLVLGMVATAVAVALAGPSIGRRTDAATWAIAMVGILPLTAVASVLPFGGGVSSLVDPHSFYCLGSAVAASLISFAVLAAWLRRGAPVSTASAGLFAGVAAGAIGSFAYGLSCRIDTLTHLGVWHVLPVLVAGLAGLILLPRIIRW
ncbi:NrsF family protein [Qipengyuania sp. CAU 1752]